MKKEKTKYECTQTIYKLYTKAQQVDLLLSKEMGRRFFRDIDFIKKLLDLQGLYKSDLWFEIYKVYPKIKEEEGWKCNAIHIKKD